MIKKAGVFTNIKLKSVIMIETFIIAVLCVLMVVNVVSLNSYNKQSIELSKSHIDYTDIALQLNLGSDILTEQVRLFAETGKKEYMDAYFEEARVSMHREKALDKIKDLPLPDSNNRVADAMVESIKLMNREYYSMRLTAMAYGIYPEELPPEVNIVPISSTDRALPQEEMKAKARSMLFDNVYSAAKQKIKTNLNQFLSEMVAASNTEYTNITEKINVHSRLQTVIISAILFVIILMALFMYLFVIHPIVNASKSIAKDLPINMPRFVEELNLLGLSYNDLHKNNAVLLEQLNEIAKKDFLTDMGNRLAYENYCEAVLTGNNKLLMFLFDVNNLRVTNNKQGHAAGDKLLINTAKCIHSVFGKNNHSNCFRIGGDEFVAFIDGEPESSAAEYLERFENETEKCGISVSAGYSYAENASKVSIKKLFNEADAMMYKNKYA